MGAGLSLPSGSVRRAVLSHDLDVLQKELARHPKAVMAVTSRKNPTMLHLAADLGDTGCLRILLAAARAAAPTPEAFLRYLETIDGSGRTALMIACRRGSSGCVRQLLDDGANPLATDRDGSSALHVAAANGSSSCVRLLLQAEVWEVSSTRGRAGGPPGLNSYGPVTPPAMSAVAVAVLSGGSGAAPRPEALEAGQSVPASRPDAVATSDQLATGDRAAAAPLGTGATPILAAAALVRTPFGPARFVDACDGCGLTALHRACLRGHVECAAALLAHSASLDVGARGGAAAIARRRRAARSGGAAEQAARRVVQDATPLHLAASFGCLPLCLLILEVDARVRGPGSTELRRARDAHGLTPLNAALLAGHYTLARSLVGAGLAGTSGRAVSASTTGSPTSLGEKVRAQLQSLLQRATLLADLRELAECWRRAGAPRAGDSLALALPLGPGLGPAQLREALRALAEPSLDARGALERVALILAPAEGNAAWQTAAAVAAAAAREAALPPAALARLEATRRQRRRAARRAARAAADIGSAGEGAARRRRRRALRGAAPSLVELLAVSGGAPERISALAELVRCVEIGEDAVVAEVAAAEVAASEARACTCGEAAYGKACGSAGGADQDDGVASTSGGAHHCGSSVCSDTSGRQAPAVGACLSESSLDDGAGPLSALCDSESPRDTALPTQDTIRGGECAICMDAEADVATSSCGHVICVACAVRLVARVGADAPACPFCRVEVGGFEAATGARGGALAVCPGASAAAPTTPTAPETSLSRSPPILA